MPIRSERPDISGCIFASVSYVSTLTEDRDQAARRGSPEEWIWWTKFPPSCKLIPKVMLPSISDDVAGLSFDAFSIAPSKYLKYLLEANLASGAKCITKDLQSISDVFSLPEFDNIHGVINCTGIGAVSLVHDPSLYPTKGQSIIVRGEAECVTTMTGDGWEAVVVPRCGEQETFLGVSKVADSWSVTWFQIKRTSKADAVKGL